MKSCANRSTFKHFSSWDRSLRGRSATNVNDYDYSERPQMKLCYQGNEYNMEIMSYFQSLNIIERWHQIKSKINNNGIFNWRKLLSVDKLAVIIFFNHFFFLLPAFNHLIYIIVHATVWMLPFSLFSFLLIEKKIRATALRNKNNILWIFVMNWSEVQDLQMPGKVMNARISTTWHYENPKQFDDMMRNNWSQRPMIFGKYCNHWRYKIIDSARTVGDGNQRQFFSTYGGLLLCIL